MKDKIIYIYPSKSSFIKSDIDFLSKRFTVKTQNLPWQSLPNLPINWFRQFIFLVRYGFKAKVIFITFAGYFSLLPVLFGKFFNKKTLLILNGADCMSFPEYNYGSLRKRLLRFFIKKSQQNASKLLPVDASLISQAHTFDKNIAVKNQGFQSFFKDIDTPTKVIPNGFDTSFWNFDENFSRVRDFISVISTNNKSTAIFKGLDLILEVAKQYPEKSFTIVGLSEDIQNEFEKTKNVKSYTFVKKEVLRKLYQEHHFYVQLSINEGFGCALAEAMLCGCIPVVSNAGALPNVAGGASYIVKSRTVDEVKNVFDSVLKLSKSEQNRIRIQARDRIVNNFPMSKREELLLHEIDY